MSDKPPPLLLSSEVLMLAFCVVAVVGIGLALSRIPGTPDPPQPVVMASIAVLAPVSVPGLPGASVPGPPGPPALIVQPDAPAPGPALPGPPVVLPRYVAVLTTVPLPQPRERTLRVAPATPPPAGTARECQIALLFAQLGDDEYRKRHAHCFEGARRR